MRREKFPTSIVMIAVLIVAVVLAGVGIFPMNQEVHNALRLAGLLPAAALFVMWLFFSWR